MQVEASQKVKDLFPNMAKAQVMHQPHLAAADVDTIVDLTNIEDPDAGNLGVPFMQIEDEDEDEWEDWVRC